MISRFLVLSLSLLAIYQVSALTKPETTQASPPMRVGSVVQDFSVSHPSQDASHPLGRTWQEAAQMEPGDCRVIVFYTPTCPALESFVTGWTESESFVPEDWINLATSDLGSRASLQAIGGFAPDRVARASSGGTAEQLGVRIVPTAVVVDAEGTVLTFLRSRPSRESLPSACTSEADHD